MHVRRFLHKTLSFVIHQKTLDSITVLVSGLLKSKNLSVTGLGRSIDLPIQERSGIKRADRLIGNPHLPEKLPAIYAQISNQLVGAKSRLKIIVDWTNVPNIEFGIMA